MLTPWVNIDHILAILPLDSRLKTHWHDGLKKPKKKKKKKNQITHYGHKDGYPCI